MAKSELEIAENIVCNGNGLSDRKIYCDGDSLSLEETTPNILKIGLKNREEYFEGRKKKCKKVTGLDLSRCKLKEIPSEVTQLPNLEMLDISGEGHYSSFKREKNLIKKLTHFDKLSNVKKLVIDHLYIKNLEHLKHLNNLEELSAIDTHVSKNFSWEKVGTLPKLKMINIKGMYESSKSADMDGMENFPALEELIIGASLFDEEDYASLYQLKNLKYVDVSPKEGFMNIKGKKACKSFRKKYKANVNENADINC
jgi:Leucine-rich repeat (LRR) protein